MSAEMRVKLAALALKYRLEAVRIGHELDAMPWYRRQARRELKYRKMIYDDAADAMNVGERPSDAWWALCEVSREHGWSMEPEGLKIRNYVERVIWVESDE